tara:strand:+ start:437 stop:862 length:426 start_codon:yes stop_codon:yes gene_type:complete
MKVNTLIDSMNSKYQIMDKHIKDVKKMITTIDISFQSMLKDFNKLDKIICNVPKRRTILHKKQNISNKLAIFLNLDANIQISRQHGVKMITLYCENMNLKNQNNGRQINLDDKLIDLFNLPSKKTIYMIEIDKYIKQHFLG